MLLFIAGSAAPAALELSLSAGPRATLADIFGSTQNDKTIFNIPNTPHFRYWYDFTAPREYNAFYTTTAGTISLGGLVRFIDEGLEIFSTDAAYQECKQALNKMIELHKDYQARPSKKKRAALEQAQVEIIESLSKVELSEQTTTDLCALLSSPEQSTLKKIVSLFILPYRSHLVEKEIPTKAVVSRGELWKEVVKYWWGGITLGLFVGVSLFPVIGAVTPFVATTFFDWMYPSGSTFALSKTIVSGFDKTKNEFIKETISLSSAMDRSETKELFIKHWGNNLMGQVMQIPLTIAHVALRCTNFKLAPEPEDGVIVTLDRSLNNSATGIDPTQDFINNSANDSHSALAA